MSIRLLLSAAAANYLTTLGKVDFFNDGSGKALYMFEENVLDESGNYNGTATNVTYGAGRFGRAAYFSTSGTQYISVPYQLFNFGTADYALSCNIRFSALPASGQRLFFGGDLASGANANGVQVNFLGNGKITINHNNETQYTSVATLAINTDYHIVTTRISGVEYVYINNILDGSFVNTINFNQSVGASIGGLNIANLNFTGYIDQSRVFSRGVTASEVTTLYTEI